MTSGPGDTRTNKRKKDMAARTTAAEGILYGGTWKLFVDWEKNIGFVLLWCFNGALGIVNWSF